MENNEDFAKVPILAFRAATLECLSMGLNQQKVIPSEEGLPRDWRGLAHLFGLNGVQTQRIAGSTDPTAALVKLCGSQATVDRFIHFLSQIDRYDVIDDSDKFIREDVKVFIEKDSPDERTLETLRNTSDAVILTVDDVSRIQHGLPPQVYDAFLLFAEEDIDFASKVVDTMEQKYHMKLCIRDRDLVGGITFEHDAIMKLIAERCRRLLVLVSKSFLQSPANKFFLTFAQALGIEQRQRKVIPILLERCILPPELSYYFLLDYTRSGVLWDFWAKLRDSIDVPEATPASSINPSPWISRTAFSEQRAIEAPDKEELQQKKLDPEPADLEMEANDVQKTVEKSQVKQIAQSFSGLFSSGKKVQKEKEEKPSKKKWFTKKKVKAILS